MKMILKKFLADVYKQIKLPFSILKTKLLMLKTKSLNNKEYKSHDMMRQLLHNHTYTTG